MSSMNDNENEQPNDTMNENNSMSNTGTSLPETNLFEEYVNTNSRNPEEPQRKKAPKWVIPICAVLVLLIVGITALFCSPTLSNAFALLTMKPADYYQKIESKNLLSKIDGFTKGFDSAQSQQIDLLKKGIGIEQTITAKAHSILTDMLGLSDLESITLKDIFMYKGDKNSHDISLLVNESEALFMNSYFDMNNGLGYFLLPALNEAYLKLSLDDMIDAQTYGDSSSDLTDINQIWYSMLNLSIDEQLINHSLKKYTKIFTDNIHTVEAKKNVELKTNTVSNKFTELTAIISPEEQYSIIEQILKTVQEDSELSNILVNSAIVTSEEYNKGIEQLLHELNSNKEYLLNKNQNLFMKVWVDNKGNLVGREFSYTQYENSAVFGYRSGKEKSETIFEAWVTVSDKDLLNIKSRSTIKNNAYTGNIDILFTDPTTGIINTTILSIKDFTSNLLNGKINGEVKISNSALAIFSIVANFTANNENQDVKLDLLQGDTSLVSLTSTNKIIPYKDITFPSDTEKSYDALTEMASYLMSSDTKGFIAELEEKVNLKAFNQLLNSYLKIY